MTDIQTKYQKLATEYAKLRAQVPVLKKAVLDEQAKEAELQEEVKEKGQSVRKLEQEVDSLSFRNQQLTARVELLQREIEDAGSKTKKNKKNNPTPAVDNVNAASAVLSEELQSKIAENASLHTRLSEAEVRHSAAVSELQRQISQLEFKAGQQQSSLDDSAAKHKQEIDKLQEDKIKLEVKFHKKDTQCREATQQMQALEEKLAAVEEKFTKELSEAKRMAEEKLQLNENENKLASKQTAVVFDKEHQLRCKELVSQAHTLVTDFVQSFMNFYTYSEQRSRAYPVDSDSEPLSPVNKQYCQYLYENAAVARPVEHAFKAFSDSLQEDAMTTLETASGLDKFAVTFDNLCNYVSKLLPYQLLSIEEECSVAICTSQLRTSNQQLGAAFRQWQAALAKLNTYVSLLAFQSSSSCDHPKVNQSHFFTLTSQAISQVHQTLLVVSKCYQKKLMLEHELPTVNDKLKITNECALSSLLSLVSVFNKMSTFFSSNLEFFSKSVQSHPTVMCFQDTAVSEQHETESVTSSLVSSRSSDPHERGAHNEEAVQSLAEEKDKLTSEVVSLQENVTKLEQEKEHWMLEFKLLQRKYEKECKKSSSAEERLKAIEAEITGQVFNDSSVSRGGDSRKQSEQAAPGGPGMDSMLGKLRRAMSEDGDAETREEFIKKYYNNKITDITKQIQLADSKAVNFHAECRALSKQLKSSLKDREKLEKDLEAAKETVMQLKDELQTTSRSYEDQLKTMTEHLTGMNDKLTTQTDEIDALKHQLTRGTKTTKKGFLGKQSK